MSFFNSMNILSSGLNAQRVRMNVTSSNLANANSTRSADGGPYRRMDAVFEAQSTDTSAFEPTPQGVSVVDIVEDTSEGRVVFDPSHPDANDEGYLTLPNVSVLQETVNMMTASRAYEAGLTAMRGLVEMAQKMLEKT